MQNTVKIKLIKCHLLIVNMDTISGEFQDDRTKFIESVEYAWNIPEMCFAAMDPFVMKALGDITPAELEGLLKRKMKNAGKTIHIKADTMSRVLHQGKDILHLDFNDYGEILRTLFFQDFGGKKNEEQRYAASAFKRIFGGYQIPPEIKNAAYRKSPGNNPKINVRLYVPVSGNEDPLFVQAKVKSPEEILYKVALKIARRYGAVDDSRATSEEDMLIARKGVTENVKDVIGTKSVVSGRNAVKGTCDAMREEPQKQQVEKVCGCIRAIEHPGVRQLAQIENLYTNPRQTTDYRAIILTVKPNTQSILRDPITGYVTTGIESISHHLLTAGNYMCEHSGPNAHFIYKGRKRDGRHYLGVQDKDRKAFQRNFNEMLQKGGSRLGLNMSYSFL
jgi:hypothetical protein